LKEVELFRRLHRRQHDLSAVVEVEVIRLARATRAPGRQAHVSQLVQPATKLMEVFVILPHEQAVPAITVPHGPHDLTAYGAVGLSASTRAAEEYLVARTGHGERLRPGLRHPDITQDGFIKRRAVTLRHILCLTFASFLSFSECAGLMVQLFQLERCGSAFSKPERLPTLWLFLCQ